MGFLVVAAMTHLRVNLVAAMYALSVAILNQIRRALYLSDQLQTLRVRLWLCTKECTEHSGDVGFDPPRLGLGPLPFSPSLWTFKRPALCTAVLLNLTADDERTGYDA
jgi:hypothetical protein